MRNLLLFLFVGCGATLVRADESILTPQKKAHWAWQKPQRSAVPAVKNAEWVRNPIDAFVLAKLEENGLKPAPAAEPVTLLRRLYFDLIGLPPTPAEVDEFVAAWEGASAKRQAALRGVVERLLASPHYGERWGRHWLDLARFAESNGYEFDEVRPDAWRYRDYVIRAFNQNKPYDRFLLEQVAGDELFPDEADARIATAFNLLGPDMTDSSNQAQRRQNTLDDMTETTGLVFMGLTIGCARCHDHKFEPILQADFFRLQAFFVPAEFKVNVPIASPEELATFAAGQKHYEALIQPTLEALTRLEAPYRAKLFESKLAKVSDEARQAHQTPEDKRTPRQRDLVNQTNRLVAVAATEVVAALTTGDKAMHQELTSALKRFDAQKPRPLPVTPGLRDGPTTPKTRLLIRGELNQPGDEVQPAWPLILSPKHQETPPQIQPGATKSSGRRAALARWLVSPDHPLTARVMVNRLWHHHFGRGIVATPSDFGVRGEPPTRPELLDWLATEFVARGWNIKEMHRLMVLSATYQQASAPFSPGSKNRDVRPPRFFEPGLNEKAMTVDPDNGLLWHANRRRLEGEIIRDSLLAVSGRLNRSLGGASVFPPLPAEMKVTVKEWPVSSKAEDHVRRSVYIFARRNQRHPFLATFDLPDSNHSCARARSTTGPQALALFNGADVAAAAQALANRLSREASSSDERIELAFRLSLGRRPGTEELQGARTFLATSPLSELCRALLNTNEFAYLD